MRWAVLGLSCLFLILAGCSTGNAKYGNPVTPVPATAAPAFSSAAGSYNSVQTVTITDATAGATIYFTMDGTVPTASSTAYTGPIKVGSTETLMAVAIAPGYAPSTVAKAAYTIPAPPATAAPVFSPAAGDYNSVQTLSITDGTARAAIYFTTDGTVPTASSTAYTGPIKVRSTETLMAVAIAPGYAPSAVVTAAYTIALAPDGKVLHGNTSISGAHVYLLAANTNGYGNASVSLLSSDLTGASDMLGGYVMTAADGSFTVSGMYQCTPNTQVYGYALGGNAGSGDSAASGLLAILGNYPQSGSFTINSPFTMNEVTTVAAAYAMAGFAKDATHLSSPARRLHKSGSPMLLPVPSISLTVRQEPRSPPLQPAMDLFLRAKSTR